MNVRIIILLSHHPDPRMLKRVKSLSKVSNDILVVFWDRMLDTPIPQGILVKRVKSSDPWTLLGRILVDLKLFFISVYWIFIKRPSIIYVSGFDMLLPGYFYKIFHPRIKLILEVADLLGGRFVGNKKLKYLQNFVNKMLKNVDLLVLTSPYFWENYYKRVFPYPEKVFLMENYPSKKIFSGFVPKKHKKLTIGFVGAVRYADQIKMLFEACKMYNDKIKVIIAGGGPDYNYIKKIDRDYSNVEATGPYNYENDIVNIYSEIDIVYSVYNADLFNVRTAIPNRLYEAIACRLPIIVAKNTVLADLVVRRYDIGFEVSHSDIRDLKNLINNIIKNPSLLEKCKENIAKLPKNFYYEEVEKRFIKRIEDLVKNNN